MDLQGDGGNKRACQCEILHTALYVWEKEKERDGLSTD